MINWIKLGKGKKSLRRNKLSMKNKQNMKK